MTQTNTTDTSRWSWRPAALGVLALGIVAGALWRPSLALAAAVYVGQSLAEVTPLVVPGILVTAWVAASGASDRVAGVFTANSRASLLAAATIGAVTPVCGVTVLPLMAGLLASGVPLAPVMAFWLASPITDPAMLATTAALLGWPFAAGKTLAAFGLGLLGGGATAALAARPWVRTPLRDTRLVRGMAGGCAYDAGFDAAIWRDGQRRRRFGRETGAMARLILICLIPAFAAEFALNAILDPGVVASYAGRGTWWAVPLAVVVGAPAYIDGYAALPLTRALMHHGMSPGAAMAFLVSGGVVSIWGAMAIAPVLRTKPFLLYLALAVTGSLAAGWLFELAMTV